jgi:hypothetical protein
VTLGSVSPNRGDAPQPQAAPIGGRITSDYFGSSASSERALESR